MSEEKETKFDYKRFLLIINTILFFAILASIVFFILALNEIKSSGVNYLDFMTKYYETQSDWLNKWLMVLGFLVAIAGIGMPIFMRNSNKEKIAQMETEFQLIKCKMENESSDMLIRLKGDITQFINDMQQEYDIKLRQFESKFQNYLNEAEKSKTITEINFHHTLADMNFKNNEIKRGLDNLNEAISTCEMAIREYPEESELNFKLCYFYGVRASTIFSTNIESARADYEKSIRIAEENNYDVFINLGYSQLIFLLIENNYIEDSLILFDKIKPNINKIIKKQDVQKWLDSLSKIHESEQALRLKFEIEQVIPILPE